MSLCVWVCVFDIREGRVGPVANGRIDFGGVLITD